MRCVNVSAPAWKENTILNGEKPQHFPPADPADPPRQVPGPPPVSGCTLHQAPPTHLPLSVPGLALPLLPVGLERSTPFITQEPAPGKLHSAPRRDGDLMDGVCVSVSLCV